MSIEILTQTMNGATSTGFTFSGFGYTSYAVGFQSISLVLGEGPLSFLDVVVEVVDASDETITVQQSVNTNVTVQQCTSAVTVLATNDTDVVLANVAGIQLGQMGQAVTIPSAPAGVATFISGFDLQFDNPTSNLLGIGLSTGAMLGTSNGTSSGTSSVSPIVQGVLSGDQAFSGSADVGLIAMGSSTADVGLGLASFTGSSTFQYGPFPQPGTHQLSGAACLLQSFYGQFPVSGSLPSFGGLTFGASNLAVNAQANQTVTGQMIQSLTSGGSNAASALVASCVFVGSLPAGP